MRDPVIASQFLDNPDDKNNLIYIDDIIQEQQAGIIRRSQSKSNNAVDRLKDLATLEYSLLVLKQVLAHN